MMTRAMADKCVSIVKNSPSIEVIDLTGGAPELNREFRHLVREMRKLGRQVLDRCNLTVLLEPRMEDLPQFLVSSLPPFRPSVRPSLISLLP
jgi:MoaA/NifB/PqqE/SkfB family radical SAM enzyme